MKQHKRGGPNRNQGRKEKYGEPSVYKSIRFPKSVIDEIKTKSDNFSEYVVESVKQRLKVN